MRQKTIRQCTKWYFKINGRECTSPAPVDGNVYQNVAAEYSSLATALLSVCAEPQVAGTLQSASYQISMSVRHCRAAGLTNGDAYSGWYSTSAMMVEELCPPLQ